MSIAGDRNIMIGSAVNQSGLFFFLAGFCPLIPTEGRGHGGQVTAVGSLQARETGRSGCYWEVPHLPPLPTPATFEAGSRLTKPGSQPSLPPVPVSGSSRCVPSHFKAALRRNPPGGDLRPSVNSQGNEPSRKQIF